MFSIQKINKVLTLKDKINFFLIIIFNFFTACLETLGIGLIFPLLTRLLNDNKTHFNNEKLNYIFEFFYKFNFLESILFILLIFYLKNFFLFFFNLFTISFIEKINLRLSNILFSTYLKNDYIFHLNNNSSKLLYNSTERINIFTESLINLSNLISEIILISMLSFLLFFTVETKTLLIFMFFLGLFSYFIYFLGNKIIKALADKYFDFENLRTTTVLQAISLIKEIKVFNQINYFFDRFNKSNQQRRKIRTTQRSINILPRILIEVFFITLIFLFIYLSVAKSFSSNEAVATLGVISLIVLRLVPSLSRVLSSIQLFSFHIKSLEGIFLDIQSDVADNSKELSELNIKSKNFKNDQVIFSFNNVSYYYDSSKYILKNINLDIYKGDVIGVYGNSGSGKTTFINLILNLISPKEGFVQPNYKKISFVSQNTILLDDSIEKNIIFGSESVDYNVLNRVIEDSNLRELIESLPLKEKTHVGERGALLSGGEIQRIGIARALYVNPDLLILDEPTSALDNHNSKQIIETISKLKDITIVMISHQLDLLNFCSKLIHIKDKKIN
jgi:ABC-type multidrug transport system fused ATPase/permease subunit